MAEVTRVTADGTMKKIIVRGRGMVVALNASAPLLAPSTRNAKQVAAIIKEGFPVFQIINGKEIAVELKDVDVMVKPAVLKEVVKAPEEKKEEVELNENNEEDNKLKDKSYEGNKNSNKHNNKGKNK